MAPAGFKLTSKGLVELPPLSPASHRKRLDSSHLIPTRMSHVEAALALKWNKTYTTIRPFWSHHSLNGALGIRPIAVMDRTEWAPSEEHDVERPEARGRY